MKKVLHVVIAPPKPGEKPAVRVRREGKIRGGFCPVPIEVRDARREACSACEHLGVLPECRTFCMRKSANKRPESECPIGKWGRYEASSTENETARG